MHFPRISHIGLAIALLAATAGLDTSATTTTGGSEVALFTPWKFIAQKLTDTFGSGTITDKQSFPKVDWDANPWILHLTGVESVLRTRIDMTSLTPQNVQLKSKLLTFSVTIHQLNLDQVIDRVVDGVMIHVHVQAQCGPITMSQTQAQTDGQLGFQVQPQHVVTHIDKFNLTWPAQSWQVSTITCQGPQGFDQTIRDEVAKDLASAELIKPWLQNLVAAKVQSEADGLFTQLGNPIPIPMDKSAQPLVLTFNRMEDRPDGILNFGALVWSGKAGEANLSHLVLNSIPPSVAKSTEPVFLSPTDGWSNLIHAQLSAHPPLKVNLNQVPKFEEFLGNEFEQFFAWPDLLNYTSYSPFTLIVQIPKTYSLQWQADGTALLQSPSNFVIRSVRAEKQWDYVNVGGTVSGKLIVQIISGKLALAIKVTDSNFTPQFGPAYVQAFQPNTKISSIIINSLQDYVNGGFKYSNTLPTLNLGIVGNAQFDGWAGISKDLISMPMKLNLTKAAEMSL